MGFVFPLGKKLLNDSFKYCVTGEIYDELAIESVCLLMNIVPCKEISLASNIHNISLDALFFTKAVSLIMGYLASTENDIGERGATSLSDALKSNTTLIELNLGC